MIYPYGRVGAFGPRSMHTHLFKGVWEHGRTQYAACGQVLEAVSYYQQEITCDKCVQAAVREWESK